MEALKKKKRNARPPAIPVSAQEWREINMAFRRMLSGRRIAQRRGIELRDILFRHGVNEPVADFYAFGAVYTDGGPSIFAWRKRFRQLFAVQRAEVSA